MKIRRFLILVVALSLVLFSLTGCGENANAPLPPSMEQNTQPEKGDETPAGEDETGGQATPEEDGQKQPEEDLDDIQKDESGHLDPEEDPNEDDKAYALSEDGKRVFFGSYPTEEVENEALAEALNEAGKEVEWTPQEGFYLSGEKNNYYFYKDIEYQSKRYRGVYFTEFRPNDARSQGGAERSFIDDNGFEIDTIYWFSYEKLSWRILERSKESALIVSEKILDSREFYPAAKGEGGRKANDFSSSSIRAFLNENFFETAFSKEEQKNISGEISLLGLEDVSNEAFFPSDEDRALTPSDYAMAQGLNMSGGARWWLKTAGDAYDFYAKYVDGSGYFEYNQYVYFTSLGVVPALKIKLFDDESAQGSEKGEEEVDEIFLSVGGRKFSVALEKNAATDALLELLKEGDISYSASEYGGFEKVGALGHTLPQSDARMKAGPLDIMLYMGDKVVLFYGNNTWSYTFLGKVQGVSEEEWAEILQKSDPILIVLSLR